MIRLDSGANLTCPNCRQPFLGQVEQIVDVGRDPSAKARLLNGQLNAMTCPHCQFRFALGAPLLYHDPDKELFLVHVPMELGLPQAEQERLIGDLVNKLMSNIPNEQRRGYMFQPRTALTMQGMIEQILQADGITPEMLEAQQVKMRLIETFLQADEEELPGLVAEHDGRIDLDFFQIMAAIAENAHQSGRPDVAHHVMVVRERLIEHSTAGQEAVELVERQEAAVRDVVAALEDLGEQATYQDFLELVLGFADDDDRLQALVGLQRPAFDYGFFQELSGRIEQLADDERVRLEALRERLLEWIDLIDQQQQAILKVAADTLTEIVNSQDLDVAIRQRLQRIDDSFLAVLAANIQAAEDRKDVVASARLKQISEAVMRALRENAPAELRLIADLLEKAKESPEAARAMIEAQAGEMGPAFLELMDRLVADLLARGDQATAQRLIALREHAAAVVGETV